MSNTATKPPQMPDSNLGVVPPSL